MSTCDVGNGSSILFLRQLYYLPLLVIHCADFVQFIGLVLKK